MIPSTTPLTMAIKKVVLLFLMLAIQLHPFLSFAMQQQCQEFRLAKMIFLEKPFAQMMLQAWRMDAASMDPIQIVLIPAILTLLTHHILEKLMEHLLFALLAP